MLIEFECISKSGQKILLFSLFTTESGGLTEFLFSFKKSKDNQVSFLQNLHLKGGSFDILVVSQDDVS